MYTEKKETKNMMSFICFLLSFFFFFKKEGLDNQICPLLDPRLRVCKPSMQGDER